MKFLEAGKKDIDDLVILANLLWPDADELENEFNEIIDSESDIVYIALEDETVAFAHFSLKRDYVNGCSGSPTGYLEGIYVKEAFRKKKIAKELIRMGEKWAYELGASEMGSDVLIDNESSMLFHEKAGFTEIERVVCYIKTIRSDKDE